MDTWNLRENALFCTKITNDLFWVPINTVKLNVELPKQLQKSSRELLSLNEKTISFYNLIDRGGYNEYEENSDWDSSNLHNWGFVYGTSWM